MDFGVFQRMLPCVLTIAEAITLYVAAWDRPLALSAQVNGYARLGQAGSDLSGLTGVEVIDVSALEVEDLTGHLHHLHSPELGEDLDRLLHDGLRAAARPGLTRFGDRLSSPRPAPPGVQN